MKNTPQTSSLTNTSTSLQQFTFNTTSNILDLKPNDEKVPPNVALGKLAFIDHMTAFCAALRSFTLAYLAIYGLYDGYDYPAFGGGKNMEWSWMKPILLRNTIVTLVTCGFWDWFLYFSPLKDKLHKYKVCMN